MSATTTFEHFHDIDAQAEQLAGFDQHYQQLEAGTYEGAFLTSEAGGVSVAVEWTNRTLYQQGSGGAGVISAVLLLSEGRHRTTRVNGQSMTKSHVLLLGDGGSFDATLEAGAVPVVLSIPVAQTSTTSNELRERFAGVASCILSPDLATRFRSVVESVVCGDATPATALLASAEMACALSSPSAGRTSGEIFRQACSMLVRGQPAENSVASVAYSVGVSRRTLDDLFKAHVGVSPAQFRKTFRLNEARRLIQTGHHSVTAAATLSGLYHLGRFSREYNALFGEMPSTTLKRARQSL